MRRSGSLVVRAVLAVCLLAAFAALGPSPAAGATRAAQTQAPPPKASIVVDVATGTVLLASNAHEARPPASTSKIMTALGAVERLPADAMVSVSALAAAQPPSKITMVAGQQWPLGDALAALMLASANDAAYAIAETAGGSLEGFAAAMTTTGERLGMQDSTFSDPAGFDDEASFQGGPRMSAYDIAIATRNALAVPELATLAATRTYEFTDPAGQQRSLTNHNKMLPGGTRAYAGATGFKTGFTNQAGHTLVATATRDGRTLIAVVLDTWDTYAWAASLLDQGFATPNEAGTGERLPDVAVSPYAQRVEDRQEFLTLARGRDAATTAATVGGATPTSAPTATTLPPTPTSVLDGAALARQEQAEESAGGGSGLFSLRSFGLVLLLLLVTLVMLRRRAVRRQRARRIARQRARAARMRSGGLPVVDGRYRTGTRVGPPVESHVRVHKVREQR